MFNDYIRRMKNILLILILASLNQSFAQSIPVEKTKIIKLDAYSLVGLGVQKVHLGYEFTPFPSNLNSLPTVQLDLYVPFSSWDGFIGFKPGIEAGAQLRFYQGTNKEQSNPNGFYIGAAIDGGFTRFTKNENLFSNNLVETKEVKYNYNRARTGIYGMVGAQSNIGKKIYFDISVGLGWSNVSVSTNQAEPAGFFFMENFNNPIYDSYNRGKFTTVYIPLNASIGYRLK